MTRPADRSASCLLGADENFVVIGFPRIVVYSLYCKPKLMPLLSYVHLLTSFFPSSALSRRRL
jgi:hypothetical protein